MDDTVRITSTNSLVHSGTSIGTDAPVLGVSSHNGIVVAVTALSLYVIGNGALRSNQVVSWVPQSVDISPNGKEVAVGGADNHIHIFNFDGNNLSQKTVLEGHRGPVTTLKYAGNGDIASGGKDRSVIVWRNGAALITGWVFHASSVTDVAWSPDSSRVASSGLDQHVYIWSVNEPNKHVHIKGAHRGGANRVAWLDNSTVFSAGQDCTIRSWKV